MCRSLRNAISVITVCLGALFFAPVLFAQETTSTDQTATTVSFRDPTTPLGYTAGVAGSLANSHYRLNSVLLSAQRKHAVINGVTLREGQVIPGSAGVVVKRISPQTVVLQQDVKTWALRLSPSVVIRH